MMPSSRPPFLKCHWIFLKAGKVNATKKCTTLVQCPINIFKVNKNFNFKNIREEREETEVRRTEGDLRKKGTHF